MPSSTARDWGPCARGAFAKGDAVELHASNRISLTMFGLFSVLTVTATPVAAVITINAGQIVANISSTHAGLIMEGVNHGALG